MRQGRREFVAAELNPNELCEVTHARWKGSLKVIVRRADGLECRESAESRWQESGHVDVFEEKSDDRGVGCVAHNTLPPSVPINTMANMIESGAGIEYTLGVTGNWNVWGPVQPNCMHHHGGCIRQLALARCINLFGNDQNTIIYATPLPCIYTSSHLFLLTLQRQLCSMHGPRSERAGPHHTDLRPNPIRRTSIARFKKKRKRESVAACR